MEFNNRNQYGVVVEDRDEDFTVWEHNSIVIEGLSEKEAVRYARQLIREQMKKDKEIIG